MAPYDDHAPLLAAAAPSGFNPLDMKTLSLPKPIRLGQILRNARFDRDVLEISQMAFKSFDELSAHPRSPELRVDENLEDLRPWLSKVKE